MTEVGPADRAKLLRSKRAEQSSILASRKRKLRELFAVATDEDGLPSFNLKNPDAPPTTAAEQKFLNECDLSLGRKFDERFLPPYRLRSFDALKQRVALSAKPPVAPVKTAENGLPEPKAFSAIDLPQTGDNVPLANGVPRQDTVLQTGVPSTDERAIPSEDQTGRGAPKVDKLRSPTQNASAGPASMVQEEQPLVNGSNLESQRSGVGLAVHAAGLPEGRFGSATTATSTEPDARDSERTNGISNEPKAADALQDGQASHPDPSRYADALSSPGSTAQSTLTTTIHEGSADTSPDLEEPQYSGKGEEDITHRPGSGHAAEDGGRVDVDESAMEAPAESTSSLPTAISGVEAQLLEESAAAQLSQTKPQANQPSSLTEQDQPRENLRSVAETHGVAVAQSPAKIASDQQDVDMVSQDPKVPAIAPRTEPERGVQGSSEPMDIDQEQLPTASKDASRAQAEHLDVQSSVAPGGTSASAAPVSENKPALAENPNPAIIVTDDVATNAAHPTATTQPPVLTTPSPSKSPSSLPESGNEETLALQTLSAPQLKLLTTKAHDRRRKSVPTVIFGKQAKKPRVSDDTALAMTRQQPGHDDYFMPLFIEGFARQSMWMKPIEKLLNQAHKTLSTSDQYVSILDHQACKILRRVYHLQQHDKWSLRQPVRCPEPTRPPSHWDVLLQEMKWMRTDFREERKWKRAVARNLALACAEWVHSSPKERKDLQVKATIPPMPAAQPATDGSNNILDDSVPELDHSDSPMEDSTMEHDEETLDIGIETIAPATIFALQDDEVVFGLQPSNTADELLANLPLYGSPLKVPKFDFVGSDHDPDARWRRPALPLSKYVEGEMVLDVKPPPRKRSRFRHPTDSEDEDGDEVIFGAKPDDGSQAQPATIDVALFNPEMRSARERLHASHQFRPPTEHAMPPQSFYECRTASQWTQAEDDQLRSLVREYSYNWSLISTIVSPRTLFPSGAERRTPWECFERWVQLEGLPSDMAKTPYFKIYQGRIDAAQKIIQEHNQKAQQVAPNGAVAPVPRRRPTTTVRVERRRNQKHLAMIDAMRKQAKKRESNAHKALQAANMRKTNEAQQPPRQQGPNKTPRDYSLMRWERDQQLAERVAQYARRTELAKRQQVPHMGQVPGTPVVVPNPHQAAAAAQLAAANAAAARIGIPVPTQLGAPGQVRTAARLPMQTPTGVVPAVQAAQLAGVATGGLVPPHQMAALPQAQALNLQAAMQAQAQAQAQVQAQVQAAQAQAQVQGQHRLPVAGVAGTQQDIGNLVLQARRIQDQQRAAVQQQQQQQQQQHQLQQQQQHQLQQQHQPQQVVQQLQQHQQAIQQPQQMAQMNGAQGSPPIRNIVNGINGGAYLSNAQAMVASFNAANSAGLAGSPGAGLSMPSMVAGSPRNHSIPPQSLPVVTQRLRELEAVYRSKNPTLPPDAIRQLATEHLSKLIVQSQQNAMNAASGGIVQQPMNGMTGTSSPHQYAQMLRAQQAQQAAAQQASQQQVNQQHQRQASGSATPVPGK